MEKANQVLPASEENEAIKVTSSDFVDKAAEKVFQKISEREETVKVFSGHYPEPEDTENAVNLVGRIDWEQRTLERYFYEEEARE